MRKTFLYVCAVAMLAIILPSCLGDNESTYSGTREFGVVSEENGRKYAAIGSGLGGTYVTWTGIDTYSKGDAMLLTYKVNTSNVISGTNILQAENAVIADSETFPARDQKYIAIQQVDTTKQANSAFFKTFSLNKYSSNTFFSDKWLFSYTASVKDGEVLTAKFFYDENKQVQKDKNDLPDNAAIIDIVLTKSGTAIEGTTTKTEDKMIVADLSSLRSVLRPSSDISESVSKSIWLRIMKEDSKATDGYVLTYIQNAGYLLYTKSE